MSGLSGPGYYPVPKNKSSIISGKQNNLSGKPDYPVKAIEEIIPIQFHRSTMQVYSYRKIKVDCLTVKTIETYYALLPRIQEEIRVMDSPLYFFIQYPKKPVILLSKEDGRLYGMRDGSILKQKQHQASIVMRVFFKYGLVENMIRQTVKIDDKTNS